MISSVNKNKIIICLFEIIFLIIYVLSITTLHAAEPDDKGFSYDETVVPSEILAPETTTGQLTPAQACDQTGTKYETLVKIPGLGSKNEDGKNIVTICPNSLGEYLQVGFNYFIGVAILLAVVMIVYGGVLYATTEAVYGKSDAKETIVGAAQGLALALGSYLILVTINPDLIKFQLDIGTVELQKSGAGGKGRVQQLAGFQNGTISVGSGGGSCVSVPESKLETVDGFQMLKTTAKNFRAMKVAAESQGITLNLRSGYRSPERQLDIWSSYKCRLVSGRAQCPSGKLIAVPCSLGGSGSNHSKGEAVDINVGCKNGTRCNSPTYRWLKTNGGRFGFYNNIPTDPPHWSATGK